jgi:hyperosmotically inducible periplasmic protein
MRTRMWIAAAVGLLVSGAFTCVGYAQQGIAEKVGEKIDVVGRGIMREAEVVTEAVRKRFDAVRTDVGRMGIPSRVYSRIHWERSLYNSKIEVHLVRDGGILLRGRVPDAAAKARAVSIALDTEGVTEVFDELSPIKTASPAATLLPSPTDAPAK